MTRGSVQATPNAELERDLKLFQQFERDSDWVYAHYTELTKQYNGEYVAVLNKRVVDHEHDLRRLMGRLRKRYGKSAADLVIKYITTAAEEIVIL